LIVKKFKLTHNSTENWRNQRLGVTLSGHDQSFFNSFLRSPLMYA